MFVYVLKSDIDGSFYVGSTKNVEQRIWHHNKGYDLATKSKKPWSLISVETFDSVSLALKRERFLKSGRGRSLLKSRFSG